MIRNLIGFIAQGVAVLSHATTRSYNLLGNFYACSDVAVKMTGGNGRVHSNFLGAFNLAINGIKTKPELRAEFVQGVDDFFIGGHLSAQGYELDIHPYRKDRALHDSAAEKYHEMTLMKVATFAIKSFKNIMLYVWNFCESLFHDIRLSRSDLTGKPHHWMVPVTAKEKALVPPDAIV